MQTQIKIMSEQGHSIRTIARVLRLSRRTVRKYLEPAAEPTVRAAVGKRRLTGSMCARKSNGKGTTVKQIGREVAPEIEYVKFWRVFRERVGRQAATSHDSTYITSQGKRPRSISATDCSLPIRSAATRRSRSFSWASYRLVRTPSGSLFRIRNCPPSSGSRSGCLPTLAGSRRTWWWTISRAGSSAPIATIPMLIRPTATLPITWALPSCQPGPINPGTRASGESAIGVVQRDFFQEVRNRVFYSLVRTQPDAAPVSRAVKPPGDERLWGVTSATFRRGEKALKAAGIRALRAEPVARRQSPSRLSYPGGEKLLFGAVCLCRPTNPSPAHRKDGGGL